MVDKLPQIHIPGCHRACAFSGISLGIAVPHEICQLVKFIFIVRWPIAGWTGTKPAVMAFGNFRNRSARISERIHGQSSALLIEQTFVPAIVRTFFVSEWRAIGDAKS